MLPSFGVLTTARLASASLAARYLARHGVGSHAVLVALVGECSIPVASRALASRAWSVRVRLMLRIRPVAYRGRRRLHALVGQARGCRDMYWQRTPEYMDGRSSLWQSLEESIDLVLPQRPLASHFMTTGEGV